MCELEHRNRREELDAEYEVLRRRQYGSDGSNGCRSAADEDGSSIESCIEDECVEIVTQEVEERQIEKAEAKEKAAELQSKLKAEVKAADEAQGAEDTNEVEEKDEEGDDQPENNEDAADKKVQGAKGSPLAPHFTPK